LKFITLVPEGETSVDFSAGKNEGLLKTLSQSNVKAPSSH